MLFKLLCKLGIHIPKLLTADVAGGAICSCGKKVIPPIVWPTTAIISNYSITLVELIDKLADWYSKDISAVTICCNTVLDRSGNLLNKVKARYDEILLSSYTRQRCYKCAHRRYIPGDSHSSCVEPTAKVKGDLVGIKKGWFAWPHNFDPLWLLECDSFKSLKTNKDTK